MTETILLVIFAIVIFVALLMTQRRQTLSSRMQAIVRIAACVVFALIAYAWKGPASSNTFAWAIGIAINALVIYALTHLADRILVKRGQ